MTTNAVPVRSDAKQFLGSGIDRGANDRPPGNRIEPDECHRDACEQRRREHQPPGNRGRFQPETRGSRGSHNPSVKENRCVISSVSALRALVARCSECGYDNGAVVHRAAKVLNGVIAWFRCPASMGPAMQMSVQC